jgi:hypothetical protein
MRRAPYLKSSFGTPALRPLYHLHGFLFTCWMVLLIVQPALVAVRRVASQVLRIAIGGTETWQWATLEPMYVGGPQEGPALRLIDYAQPDVVPQLVHL